MGSRNAKDGAYSALFSNLSKSGLDNYLLKRYKHPLLEDFRDPDYFYVFLARAVIHELIWSWEAELKAHNLYQLTNHNPSFLQKKTVSDKSSAYWLVALYCMLYLDF